MNRPLSPAQLKASARRRLDHAGPAPTLATFLVFGPNLLLRLIITIVLSYYPAYAFQISGVTFFLLDFVLFYQLVGYRYFFLKFYCSPTAFSPRKEDRRYKTGDIWYPFRHPQKNMLALTLFTTLLVSLYRLPTGCLDALFEQTSATGYYVAYYVLTTADLIIGVVLWLRLSQTAYLLVDFPQMSVRDLMRASKKMMNGSKARLYYIAASFVPWFLLSVCTFGIFLLWVLPYYQSVMTEFYLDLAMRSREK